MAFVDADGILSILVDCAFQLLVLCIAFPAALAATSLNMTR